MKEYFYQRDRKVVEYCSKCMESTQRFYVESEIFDNPRRIVDVYTPCRLCYPDDFKMYYNWRVHCLTKDQKRKNDIAHLGLQYGSPDNFKDIDLKFYADNDKSIASDLDLFVTKFIENFKPNALFYGKAGTGKTMAAFAICNALQYELYYPKYITHSQLKNAIIRSYNDRNTPQILNHYINADILFLDEFGSITQTESDKAWLFDIIDGRYLNKRPTVLIVNIEIGDLKKFLYDQLGYRAYDRFRGNVESYCFEGESYRGKRYDGN